MKVEPFNNIKWKEIQWQQIFNKISHKKKHKSTLKVKSFNSITDQQNRQRISGLNLMDPSSP